MLIHFFYTHFIGWFSLLVYQLGMKKKFPMLYVCGKHLATQTIDRLPKSYKKSLTGPLRIFRIGIDAIFKKRIPWRKMSDEPVAIYNGNLSSLELRSEYLNVMCGERAGITFSKDMLSSSMALPWKLLAVVSMFFSSLFLMLFIPFSKHRENLSLLPLSLVETAHFLHLLRKFNIKKVNFFCIYLSDANLNAWLLQKYKIEVNKIPSEVPLGFLNQEIISDSLALCFRYQNDEVKHFASGMHVKQYYNWVPETVFTNASLYVGKTFPSPGLTLGFYSSAMWLRVALGHMDFNDHAEEAEAPLCRHLGEYTQKHPGVKLQIYLHPLEKTDAATLARTRKYYDEQLKGVPYEIANETQPTVNCFQECNLAVSVYSTVMFERLFFGYKCILHPEGLKDFPIAGSAFGNICSDSKEKLFEMLDRNLPLSADEFFIANSLHQYTWKDYDRFTQSVLNRKSNS
jgi:hypothetical protein